MLASPSFRTPQVDIRGVLKTPARLFTALSGVAKSKLDVSDKGTGFLA